MIPQSLDQNIVYLASQLTKAFHKSMQDSFKLSGFNITSEQFTILTQLWYQDGRNQQELAKAIGRDKTTVSRVLNTMLNGGLIQRTADTQDKRYRIIQLTPHGKRIQNQLVALSGAIFLKTLSDIPEEEIEVAIKVLKILNKNLS